MPRRASPVRGTGAEVSAPVFAALGDPTRLRLVTRLCASGPMSITQLTREFDVTRQGITKHLNVLADVGLARGVRFGREVRWELDPEQLAEAKRYLEQISLRWDEALGRLRKLVEED